MPAWHPKRLLYSISTTALPVDQLLPWWYLSYHFNLSGSFSLALKFLGSALGSITGLLWTILLHKGKRLRVQAADYGRPIVLNWEWFCPLTRRHLSISDILQLAVTIGKGWLSLASMVETKDVAKHLHTMNYLTSNVPGEQTCGRRPWLLNVR